MVSLEINTIIGKITFPNTKNNIKVNFRNNIEAVYIYADLFSVRNGSFVHADLFSVWNGSYVASFPGLPVHAQHNTQ